MDVLAKATWVYLRRFVEAIANNDPQGFLLTYLKHGLWV